MNKIKNGITAVFTCLCVVASAYAVTINDEDTIDAVSAGVTYMDTTEISFAGSSADIDKVGTLYFSSSASVGTRTGGRPDPEDASTLAVASGKTGRIHISEGELLTIKSGAKYFSVASDAALYLQGNMLFNTSGTAIGGDMYSSVYLSGEKLALLDNGASKSLFSVIGDLHLGSASSGTLNRLSIGGKSTFQVQQNTVSSSIPNGMYIQGGTTLELTGSIENGHVFFETTNLYVGGLLSSKMAVDVDGIIGMKDGDSFILIAFSDDIWESYGIILDPTRLDEVAETITFTGTEADRYSVEWDETGQNLVVSYTFVPEPAEAAFAFGLLAVSLAVLRRRK